MLGFGPFARERRQFYTVHEAPQPPRDRVERAEALEFVRDGFVWPAFVLPPVWLAARGIWMGVLAYGGCIAVIAAASSAFVLAPPLSGLTLLAVNLIFGFEADEMWRADLTKRGWDMVGQVTGTGALDCERRFFEDWLPSAPMLATASAARAQQAAKGADILSKMLAPFGRRGR